MKTTFRQREHDTIRSGSTSRQREHDTIRSGSTSTRKPWLAALAIAVFMLAPTKWTLAGIVKGNSLGTAGNNTTSASLLLTLTAGASVGNTVIVTFAMDPASGSVTCADSKGNIYTSDMDVTNGSGTSGVRTVVCSAAVTNALVSGNTITISHPSVASKAVSATEFSGLDTAARVDQTVSATGTSATPSSGPTAATSQPAELLIGAIGVETKGSESFTPTAGSGYTALAAGASSSSGTADQSVTIDPEYRVVSASVPPAEYEPLALTTRYSGSIVTL